MENTTEDIDTKKFVADAVMPLIKMVVLANAGGVAATITVIGATAKSGNLTNVLALPLGLFALGVAFAIGLSFGLLHRITLDIAAKMGEKLPPDPFMFLTTQRSLDITGYGAVILFFLGCLSGVLIVALTSTTAIPAQAGI